MKKDRFKRTVMILFLVVSVSTGMFACSSSGDGVVSPLEKFLCALFFGLGGDPDTGIVMGTDGRGARTTDGGVNWTGITTGIDYGINDVTFKTGGLVGVAVGEMGKTAWTDDGGLSWNQVVAGADNNLNSVAWGGAGDYWAVGDKGAIYYSQDDGKTWVHQDSKTTENLNGVCFFNQNLGWAVGDNGVVSGTTNGADWQVWNSPVSVKLRGCFTDGLSFSLAWGDNGTLIKSDNFGSSFKAPIQTGTTKNLYDFKLRPSLTTGFLGTGIMVGDNVILKTADFGNNWTTVLDEAQAGSPFLLLIVA